MAGDDIFANRSTLLPPAAGRWSLRVELKDEEIARLYAQGLTRGALVWRTGMPEWRPLLITPELSRLLHRTPIKLHDASAPALDEEVTLPRPARLPSDLSPSERGRGPNGDVPTVAPSAVTVAPLPARAPLRRRAELAAVALLGFCVAWFARSDATPEVSTAAAYAAAAAAAAAPTPPAVTAAPTPERRSEAVLASGGGIPHVALDDLPLLGPRGRATRSASAHTSARSRASAATGRSGDGPTREQLMAALGQVARVASGCGERNGPVRVVIAFAPSGVARSIQVSGKQLSSEVRSCIIGAASRARVASFTGDPVTVSKTL